MSGERWIVIPNWREFQHYRKRDPSWIKSYTRQHADDAYLALTPHRRALLHDLRLAFASHDGQLTLNTRSLSRHLQLRVTMRDLEALNDAGFIAFSASKPLALRYQSASPETETEKSIKPPPPQPPHESATFVAPSLKPAAWPEPEPPPLPPITPPNGRPNERTNLIEQTRIDPFAELSRLPALAIAQAHLAAHDTPAGSLIPELQAILGPRFAELNEDHIDQLLDQAKASV